MAIIKWKIILSMDITLFANMKKYKNELIINKDYKNINALSGMYSNTNKR